MIGQLPASTAVEHGRREGPASARGIVILTAGVAALGGLLFRYDTSVISGAMLFLRTDFHLSEAQLEFAVGIALAGALLGSALAGYGIDRWGRRTVLLAIGIGFGVFSVLSGSGSFSIARLFVGACAASLVTPLYLAEMSPAKIRGALVSLNQLAITVGIVVAYCRLRFGGRPQLAVDVYHGRFSCRRLDRRNVRASGKSPVARAERTSRTRARGLSSPRPRP